MAFDPSLVTSAFAIEDGFQTTLSNSITATDLPIPLATLPVGVEGTLTIDPGTVSEEEIYFTSLGTGVVNCPSTSQGRGVNGTAIAHNAGAPVKMLVTKAYLDSFKYIAINAVSNLGTDGWTTSIDVFTVATSNQIGGTAGQNGTCWGTITTPGNKAATYSPGMRILFGNPTDKYGIVTSCSYAAGTDLTTLTVFCGTYSTLLVGAVSYLKYSTSYAPAWFPVNKAYWTIEVLSTTNRLQTTVPYTEENVWRQAEAIVFPPGEWDTEYTCVVGCNNGTSYVDELGTALSGSNTSADDVRFIVKTGTLHQGAAYPVGTSQHSASAQHSLSVQTTYYLIYALIDVYSTASVTNMGIYGAKKQTVIRAVCAYL